MSRMERLRKIAYENGILPNHNVERDFLVHKAILENPVPLTHNIRRSQIDEVIFHNYSIEIDPDELLVGRFSNQFTLGEEEREINEKGAQLLSLMGDLGGTTLASTGHRVIDYEKLLSVGIKGVLEEIEEKLSLISYSDPEAVAKKTFYLASKTSLEGVCHFASRYHEKLMELYEQEENAIRKAEYFVMANNFSKAPYLPCTHFYEALQCMWFMQFSLCLIFDKSLTGRLDNYLYPYYKKDIESGYITREFAFELIENLYLKHNEIYNAWPASVMLGGVDRENRPVWNEITYMCVEAIETTGLVNPAVSVCYTKDMPDDLLQKCIDIIAKGYTKPALFNDHVIQEGLKLAGVSDEDARYYVHSTCVEITPIAAANILVATPYINLNKAIEYLFNNKKEIYGDPCQVEKEIDFKLEEINSFEEFYQLMKQVMSEIIRVNLIKVCEHAYSRERYSSSPLASAFLNDCLQLGKDAGAGGAKYNFVYPCFPGFLNLVDAMQGIKTAVFDEKVLSLAEVARLCKTNFQGEERWRLYLLNKCGKFGNGIEEVDQLGNQLYHFIRKELEQYKISIGGSFYSSYFAYHMHGKLGALASATPDGRKQGEALSECLGAVQGRDKNGPTGVLQSIRKIDQRHGIGGIATNFRFSKNLIGSKEGKEAIINYIKTFMDSDCFEIQFNVVDQEDLKRAKLFPEEYKTLMVRVAGYSDYFVNLTDEVQNEIIKRNEHDMMGA